MRKARTTPTTTVRSPQAEDGQFDEPRASTDSASKMMRPPLLARRTPIPPPPDTKIRTHSPIETGSNNLRSAHAATLPVTRPDTAHKTSFESRDSDGIPKEKKKGVSFLSRFIPGSKKRESDNEGENHDSDEQTESRPEGVDAQLFSHDVEGIEYHPRYPQPPPYIRFRTKYKKEREFDRVFLAQELAAGNDLKPLKRRVTGNTLASPNMQQGPLQSNEDAIWCMEFSKDGKYLAAAGQDKTIRVWAVLSTSEERRMHEKEEDEETGAASHMRLDAPVFQQSAIREYEGHEGSVIDLSWSKNNFLLSASADKTVRLWHISRAECLCTFKHTEHVHSVQFHPRDDRFFLAGSRDMKLRFWSIPDKSVAFWQQLTEVITAVAFTPDGKTALAGTINGVCNFYETEGLKYQTQLHVRSAYGKNAKGSKICSIETLNMSERDGADVKLLISSNDARVRMYNLRDKSLEIKFKGHKSEERTIKAQFSDNGQYIISGSEDKSAFLWSTGPLEGDKPSHRPVEFFEATTSQTTCALMAPTKTRQLLAQSEDPIYDVCNPPPVTLLSRSESAASSRAPTDPHTSGTSASPKRKASESPAYTARSTHPGGNIIVTASSTGLIRVYRQDCAFTKRKSNEDSASIFSKKPSSIYMARAMSRTSNKDSRSESVGTQAPSERILNWRQGVGSTASLERNGRHNSDTKSTRSISPNKSGYSFRRSESVRRSVGNGLTKVDNRTPPTTPAGQQAGESASTTSSPASQEYGTPATTATSNRQLQGSPSRLQPEHLVPHPPYVEHIDTPEPLDAEHDESRRYNGAALPSPTPPNPFARVNSNTDCNPLWLSSDGHSYMGWDKHQYASLAINRNDGLMPPPLQQSGSYTSVVSKVSSEATSREVSSDDDAANRQGRPGTAKQQSRWSHK